MKCLFLTLGLLSTIHESEIEQSARIKAQRYTQFISAMEELEEQELEPSQLLIRRNFKIGRIYIEEPPHGYNADDTGWLILSPADFE